MMNEKKRFLHGNVRRLTYGGILAAVILVATVILQFPIPALRNGYIHMGDGAIMAAAMIIGPFAAISAGLGSALADLLSGYPTYAPATLLIKGCMGLIAGLAFKRKPNMPVYQAGLWFAFCEAVMVIGYFVYETFFYALTTSPFNLIGGAAAAAAALPFNIIQGLAGVVLGLATVPLAARLRNMD